MFLKYLQLLTKFTPFLIFSTAAGAAGKKTVCVMLIYY